MTCKLHIEYTATGAKEFLYLFNSDSIYNYATRCNSDFNVVAGTGNIEFYATGCRNAIRLLHEQLSATLSLHED